MFFKSVENSTAGDTSRQFEERGEDKFHEECGIFGVINSPVAIAQTMLGLHSLQHRGQEGCGICYYEVHAPTKIEAQKDYGIVSQTLMGDALFAARQAKIAVGHVRYSTSGNKIFTDVQPFFAHISGVDIALAHNGNLVNAGELRNELLKTGSVFNTNIDSEVFLHLIAKSKKEQIEDKIADACQQIKGGYAVIVITPNKIIGFRDPNAIRPLTLAKKQNEDGGLAYFFASETVAFNCINASPICNVEAGQLISVELLQGGDFAVKKQLMFAHEQIERKFCLFEYIYFARPDSFLEGNSVYNLRKKFGEVLAQKVASLNIAADIVVPVPDSGVPSALGYANVSGLPFELGLVRSHYSGRSFIAPTQEIRENKVKLKHNVNTSVVEGKSIILVDDSIVRGTTSKQIVQLLRDGGARQVHLAISSPPTVHPCYYGVDTPEKNDLLAFTLKSNCEQIAAAIGADSVTYLTLEEVYSTIKTHSPNEFCDMCFSGKKVVNY